MNHKGNCMPKTEEVKNLLEKIRDLIHNHKNEAARAPPVKPDVTIRKANFRQARRFNSNYKWNSA